MSVTGWSAVQQHHVYAGMSASLRSACAGDIPRASCCSSCSGDSKLQHGTTASLQTSLPMWPTAADGAEWPWAAIMPGTLAPEPHRTTQDCLPPARPCCKEPPQRGMSMVRQDQPCHSSLPKWEANAYKFILANISQFNQECDQNSTSKGIHRMLPYWEKLDWQLTSALSSFF